MIYVSDVMPLLEGALRRDEPQLRALMSNREYLTEFRTIHLNLGRRSGKTQWASKQTNALIFVHSFELSRFYYGGYALPIGSARTAAYLGQAPLRPRKVIFDEVRLCEKSALKGWDQFLFNQPWLLTDRIETIYLLGR